MHACAVRIETVESGERLLDLIDEWRDLAAAAAVPNIFCEPMAIVPALDYPDAAGMFWLIAWGSGSGGQRQLIGMLPVGRWRRKLGALLPRGVESWDYPLKAFGEPLVRAGRERDFWAAALAFLDDYRGASFLRLTQMWDGSPSVSALLELGAELGRPVHVTRQKERAMLRGPVSIEEYRRRLPTRMLADKRRRRRRLEELGTVVTERLDADADPSPWIEELIELETRGWKGRRGVAAGSDPHQEGFTRHLLSAAHADGRLDMRRLRLDGKTISMITHVGTGSTAVSFKITYDEAYAHCSPGVLLQLDYLEDGLRHDWVDSCATPGHPMYDRIWLERLPIVTLMVPFDRAAARIACAAEQRLRAAASRLRRHAAGRKAGLRAGSSTAKKS